MATYVGELRRLVLIEDMIDSIKFGIFLWVMTYIGAWFNGLTLMILGLVSMFSLPKTYEVYQEQIDAYLAIAQDQVKGIMAHVEAHRAKLPEILKEKSEHYVSLLKKQMPKDLDEAKDMALRFYNNVVELIHAKIPIGKKEQNGYHQTQNPSKARQLKQTNKTSKQTIRYMKNNTIQQQQQRRLIFRAEWTALNFCFSIYQLKTDVENELHPGSRDRRRGFQIESITVTKSDHQLPLSRNFNSNFATSARRKQNQQKVNSINALDLFFFLNSACILDALIRFVFCITCSFV